MTRTLLLFFPNFVGIIIFSFSTSSSSRCRRWLFFRSFRFLERKRKRMQYTLLFPSISVTSSQMRKRGMRRRGRKKKKACKCTLSLFSFFLSLCLISHSNPSSSSSSLSFSLSSQCSFCISPLSSLSSFPSMKSTVPYTSFDSWVCDDENDDIHKLRGYEREWRGRKRERVLSSFPFFSCECRWRCNKKAFEPSSPTKARLYIFLILFSLPQSLFFYSIPMPFIPS